MSVALKSHFFLKLSNKMKKRRKQSIFDFNHIDPQIQEEELEEIKNLFRFYHKRFWCLKQAHSRFKKMNLLMNLTSSGLVAIGAIAGGVTMNPIVLGVISGVGLIVKTASEMKNLKSKIEMAKFAFTTYEKTLSNLRFALRGGNFDQTEFLSSMEAIDGIVIDLGLDWEKFENKWQEKVFDGVISSQMRFKKRLFPDKPLERRKRSCSPNSLPKTSLKFRG